MPHVEESDKPKSISPFDFVNEIYYGKNNLIVDEWSEKQYNPYITNLTLSFGVDTVLYANEMNRRPFLDNKMQFDYLLASVRKKKRYNKWEKKEKQNKHLESVKKFFNYSNSKAIEALKILTPKQLEEIEQQLSMGGAGT